MYLIKPSVEIITPIDAPAMMARIEAAARTCYRSEAKATPESAPKMIKSLIARQHFSVLEHESISIRIICDRGVSHELVRHRLASFSQESTRYCNYSPDKKEMQFIIPPWCNNLQEGEFKASDIPRGGGGAVLGITDTELLWLKSMLDCEANYNNLLKFGWKPEQARSVLTNSLKTEFVMTANMREWRHILNLRTDRTAHPQAREVMNDLYDKFIAAGLGVFFEDIQPYRE